MSTSSALGRRGALALLGGAAALPAVGAEDPPVTLLRTRQWDLAGPGGPRRIFAYRPEGEPPAGGFPVLYLLDGNAVFLTAVEALLVQQRRAQATGVHPMAIVAVGYPTAQPFDTARRARDYTPAFPGAPEGSGGADAFLDQLLGGIAASVAERMPVNPARAALFGHSYGGLFALHAFLTRPGAFRRTIAASPSLWFAGGAMMEAVRRFVASPPPNLPELGLLLTVGGLEEEDPAMPPARQATLRERAMVSRAREVAGLLSGLGPRGPEVGFQLFDGENHGSVLPGAVNRALRFVG
ncbi:alpha/beta hydrolase [Roseococcus pinisoli]|uniref:alpha/beta hydrolase n=1 Tax=Roseococcus pinisoli TaxID=2835040 RepID=UPI00322041FD